MFFYHYKTGEVDDAISDLETDNESPIDDESIRDNELLEEEGSDGQLPGLDDKASKNDFSIYPTTDSKTAAETNLVADDELLIGLLRRESGPVDTTTQTLPTTDSPTVDQAVFTENYDHLSRLKRKLKRCL